MAMFRRRTDRIYATLQQVQRRITQGTEPGAASQSAGLSAESEAPVPPPPSIREVSRALTGGASAGGYLVMPDGTRHATSDGEGLSGSKAVRSDGDGDGDGDRPSHQAAAHGESRSTVATGEVGVERPRPPAPQAEPHASLAPRRLEVSFELVLVVLVLWLGSVAASYLAGRSQGGEPEAAAGDFFAATDDEPSRAALRAGNRQNAQPSPAPNGALAQQPIGGGMILVLSSVARSTPQALEEFVGLAKQYNDIARNRGYQPWFGVRRTSSSGLQFIYGQVGDRFGIQMQDEQVQKLFRELKAQPDYKDAYWQQAH